MGEEADSNLEMRCSVDEAWYDGTLSFSPESRDQIVVHFNDFDEDENEKLDRADLRDPAKLRSRVRVRSVQLQDSQCNMVSEGQKICGCLDDGEDRKYYDAQVTSIEKKPHAKDDGDECLCKFTVYWLEGPKKRDVTVVGCAEICFLSTESPEDDPMVKKLLQSLGDQPRRKVAKSAPKAGPNSVPSPRPRTPSPRLELAPSSKEPSPPVNPKVPELARTTSLPIGSKKKRIMQAGEQHLASAHDKLEKPDGGGIASPKDTYHGESDDEAEESAAADRRVTSDSKGPSQARGRKRVAPGNAKAAREGVVEDSIPRPLGAAEESSNPTTKKTAASDRACTQDNSVVTQSLAERVKTVQRKSAAASLAANTVQSSGEQVKLKIAQKDTVPKTGKQLGRKQTPKQKVIQLEAPAPDPLRSQFDRVVKPRSTARPRDVVGEPSTDEPCQTKRKVGRPRKHPLATPAESDMKNAMATPQQAPESSREQDQSPQEEEPQHASVEEHSSDPATKKRSRNEESAHHDSEDIVSDRTSHEEQPPLHAEKQRNARASKKRITGAQDRNVSPHDDNVSHSNDTAADHQAHSPTTTSVDEATAMPYMEYRVSLKERILDIQNKYSNGSTLSTPQPAQGLITGLSHSSRDNRTEDQQVRTGTPLDPSDSYLIEDGVEDERREGGDATVLKHAAGSRMLLLENLECDASALDAMRVLQAHTEGLCAVHVLPVMEFDASATGFALYHDGASALAALRWLTPLRRFVASPNGRPWIVSLAKEVYGSSICGFAAHTAYKSDSSGMCGIISDQPHAHDLVVVTTEDISAHLKAQQMCKVFEEQKNWRKELYERIVQHG